MPVSVFREHPGGTYVRILTFIFLLTSAPPIQAQMLDNPAFQLQEQGLSNGYFSSTYNTVGASDMPRVTVEKL